MIKNLILSGGAFRCCSHIGVVKYLEDNKAICSIDTFIGTSAGSLVCLCLCLGMTSEQLTLAINQFIKLQSECPPDIEKILDLYNAMGINDGDIIYKFVSQTLKRLAGVSSMTFIEFAKHTGKNFVVYASRLPDLDSFYFSVDTTPELDVATAIRASCSLPFVFTPVIIKDTMYIDAGLVHNFPYDYVRNNKLKDTLGVQISTKTTKAAPSNLGQLFRMITSALMRKANQAHGEAPPCLTIVKLVQEGDGLDINFDVQSCAFNISEEKVQEYIRYGYEKMKDTFDRRIIDA